MKLVKQTTRWNCGSACLAMIFDCTVDEAEEHLLERVPGELRDPDPPDGASCDVIGVSHNELEIIFWKQNIRHTCIHTFNKDRDVTSWFDRCGHRMPLAAQWREIMKEHEIDGGIIMLGVESKNRAGHQHWILLRGGDTIYDPGMGNLYEPGDTLPIHSMYLLDMKEPRRFK